jgi:hypothetical protein
MALVKKGEKALPPYQKTGKVKNATTRQKYKRDNPCCELCLLEGELTAATELHHIKPGLLSSDFIWNMINLCWRHHQEATEHINGESAQKLNLVCLTIKLLKKEITEEILEKLLCLNEVLELYHQLLPGWIELNKDNMEYEDD